MPVVAVAPNNVVLEKLKSNLEEVKARGGRLYIFADKKAGFKSDDISQVFEIDAPMNPVAPILFTIPLQLLAYHCAITKGTNVDMPREPSKISHSGVVLVGKGGSVHLNIVTNLFLILIYKG